MDKFQSLERDRLTVIREQVSKYYETEQMCVVDLGSHANQMQDKMKAVDVDEDLQGNDVFPFKSWGFSF